MKKKNVSFPKEVDVLYQRLGRHWYAFAVVNQEVYVGKVSPSLYRAKKQKSQKALKAAA